jgi:hypothetical protein
MTLQQDGGKTRWMRSFASLQDDTAHNGVMPVQLGKTPGGGGRRWHESQRYIDATTSWQLIMRRLEAKSLFMRHSLSLMFDSLLGANAIKPAVSLRELRKDAGMKASAT